MLYCRAERKTGNGAGRNEMLCPLTINCSLIVPCRTYTSRRDLVSLSVRESVSVSAGVVSVACCQLVPVSVLVCSGCCCWVPIGLCCCRLSESRWCCCRCRFVLVPVLSVSVLVSLSLVGSCQRRCRCPFVSASVLVSVHCRSVILLVFRIGLVASRRLLVRFGDGVGLLFLLLLLMLLLLLFNEAESTD